jgi:hypothetical protein
MKAGYIGFISVLVISSLFGSALHATLVEPRVVNISRSTSPITVDGLLDEAVWESVERTTNFWQRYPYDSAYSKLSTEVMLPMMTSSFMLEPCVTPSTRRIT